MKNRIFIVQVGSVNDPVIKGIVNKLGLSVRESAFLVQNSKLHISGDGGLVHFAGSVETPLLTLYGSHLPEVVGPYFKGRQEALSARKDLPSYQLNEDDAQINFITPEMVANKAFEVLGVKDRIKIKTLYFGEFYYNQQVNLIPDFNPPIEKIVRGRLVIRLDVEHNENVAAAVIRARQEQTVLVTKTVPTDDFLKFAKQNTYRIVHCLEEGYQVSEMQRLRESGIPYNLIWQGDKEKIHKVRMDLFDFEPVVIKPSPRVEGATEKSWFKTDQVFVGREEHYATLWHYKNRTPGSCHQIGRAIDDEDFWDSMESLYFFEKL